jgi:hypothetical protein
VTSIPALLLYDPVINRTDYVLGAGADNRIFVAAFLELLLIVGNIGSAVIPFPLFKRQHEGAALGFVAARIMECTCIAVGILAVLSVVTLRRDVGGAGAADPAALVVAGRSLVAVKDWTFLLGPGFVVGIGNGLLLGYLIYRSGLMPRRLALLGLVGGPLVCISGIAVLFDLVDLGSAPQFVMTIPEILWELSLCIYPTVKGFKPTAITAASDRAAA